jgi:DNA polymerase elongation subunit (family B)
MKKIYGERIRLTPKEVEVIREFRKGNVDLRKPVKIDKNYSEANEKAPKILLLDVETAPLEGLLWRLRTEYVAPNMLTRDNWFLLSWSAKWLFDKKMMNDVATPEEAIAEDDARISRSIWKLIDEADIVISHNGKNFDHKMLNMRFLMNGLNPPSPYRIIDTYQVARSNFSLPSYSLNFIANLLEIGEKLKHEGVGMWKKCLVGDKKALKNMVKYNDKDVFILEDIYLVFRPWIKNHPAIGVYLETETPVCSVCGGKHLEPAGFYRTNMSKFKNFRCQECGSPHNRQRVSALPLDIRKKLITGIPG